MVSFTLAVVEIIERRLWEHAQGLVKSTKNRRPLMLIYKEEFATKREAETRERYFKGGGNARNLLIKLIKEQRL